MILSRIHITRFSLLISGAILSGWLTACSQFHLLNSSSPFQLYYPFIWVLPMMFGAGQELKALQGKSAAAFLFFGCTAVFLALELLLLTNVPLVSVDSPVITVSLINLILCFLIGLITGSQVWHSRDGIGESVNSDTEVYVWSLFMVIAGAGLSMWMTTLAAAWNGYSAQLLLLMVLSAAGGLLNLVPSKPSTVAVSKQPDAMLSLSRNRREVSILVVVISALSVVQCTLHYFTAVFGDSVYTPVTVISVWGLLIGAGMAGWQRWLSWRWTGGADGYRVLIIVTAFASAGWVFLLNRLSLIQDHTAILAGDGRFRTIILCFLVSLLALALPSLCHGALLARHLSIQLHSKNVGDSNLSQNVNIDRRRIGIFAWLLGIGVIAGLVGFPVLERMIGIAWIIAAIPQLILVLAPRATRTWFVAALAVTGFSVIFLVSHRMPEVEISQSKVVTSNQLAASAIWGEKTYPIITVLDPDRMPDEMRSRWEYQHAARLHFHLSIPSHADMQVLDFRNVNNRRLAGVMNREFFQVWRKATGSDGWFILWFPVNDLDAGSFRLLISTFNQTFEQSHMILQDDGAGSFVAGLFGAGPGTLCNSISGLETSIVKMAALTGRSPTADLLGGYLGDKEWMNSRFGVGDSSPIDTLAKRKLVYRIPVHSPMKTSEFISWIVTDWATHLNESVPPFFREAGGKPVVDPDSRLGASLKIRRKVWFLYLEALSLRNRGEIISSLERLYLAAIMDPTFEPLYRYLIPPARSVHEDSDPIVKKIHSYLSRLKRL